VVSTALSWHRCRSILLPRRRVLPSVRCNRDQIKKRAYGPVFFVHWKRRFQTRVLLVGCGFARCNVEGMTSVYRSLTKLSINRFACLCAVTLNPNAYAALQESRATCHYPELKKLIDKELSVIKCPLGRACRNNGTRKYRPGHHICAHRNYTVRVLPQLLCFYGPWSSGQAI
jgi:hypothetical protein